MTWPNKTLKQQDTFRCMAYVAAMIAGCDVEEVFRFCGHDGSATDDNPRNRHPDKRRGFTNQEINAFLASRGLSLNSCGAQAENGKIEFKEYEGSINLWVGAWIPAYLAAEVVVESDRIPGGTHSVYWDGKVIRDSNPDKPDETSISDYRIRSWHPVVNLNEGEYIQFNGCPSCAAKDARIAGLEKELLEAAGVLKRAGDVEGMARLIHRHDTECAAYLDFDEEDDDAKEAYRQFARAVSAYLLRKE